MELDQRETSLREQKDKFPPAEFERAISLIQDERAVVGRILEIMNSRNVRNLKSQEEIFKAIAEALSSADEMINIDLPVYFPERLHKYFELYHKDRMEKVAESSLTR
jgi:pyruvate-formate lyase-activating enzyme